MSTNLITTKTSATGVICWTATDGLTPTTMKISTASLWDSNMATTTS